MHNDIYNVEKVKKIVEELKTACQEDVYIALAHAPNANLIAMRNMISHIIKIRKKEDKKMIKEKQKEEEIK